MASKFEEEKNFCAVDSLLYPAPYIHGKKIPKCPKRLKDWKLTEISFWPGNCTPGIFSFPRSGPQTGRRSNWLLTECWHVGLAVCLSVLSAESCSLTITKELPPTHLVSNSSLTLWPCTYSLSNLLQSSTITPTSFSTPRLISWEPIITFCNWDSVVNFLEVSVSDSSDQSSDPTCFLWGSAERIQELSTIRACLTSWKAKWKAKTHLIFSFSEFTSQVPNLEQLCSSWNYLQYKQ